MMNVKEIYLKLVKDEIKVSESLAFTQIFVSLSDKDADWVRSEISGYNDNVAFPFFGQPIIRLVS